MRGGDISRLARIECQVVQRKRNIALDVRCFAAVDTIAQAQSEQLSGITQLDAGIAEISRTTQEAAGQSQQVAATARQSSEEVETLRGSVARFKIENLKVQRAA